VVTLVVRDARSRVVGAVTVTRRPVTIGRAPECTVVLNSSAVSRKHASVYMQEDGSIVINDEGSANGVKVDGTYITGPTLVSEANRIAISDFALTIEPEGRKSEPEGPTLPAPKRAAAPDTDEDVDLDTVLEARAGAGTLLASTSIQLVGRGGAFDGTCFTLDKPLMTVGRTEDNDVVLDDPSISRRHSQIRLSATCDRITVLDLRSSNGTFVEGQRVKRAECEDGTIVRFGDLAFKVTLVRQQAGKPKRRINRRMILLGSLAVVVLLVVVGVIAVLRRPPPLPKKKITAEERLRQLQAEVQSLVDDGRRRMAQRQWTAAIQVLEKAQAKDPLNNTAKRLRRRALDELSSLQIYAKASEFFGLGNKENLVKAKEIYHKVPTDSIYYREVRDKLQTINERLSEGYRIEGVSRCKARYWEQCHEALCKFFELLPEGKTVPGESHLRNQLNYVVKLLRRRRDFVPCEAKRFLHPAGAGEPGESPGDVIAEKYDEKALQRVLMLYFNGRIENALRMLGKLGKKREMRPHWATLREINRQLLIIRGKYQEGYSALRERDATGAQKHWRMVLTADAELIPSRIESFYRREIKRALGDLYYELGDEEYKVMRYPQAFALWIEGKRVNDAHERILNGLLQLEAVAERLVREAKQLSAAGNFTDARDKLETAKKITDDKRPVHIDAVSALAELK
jgi:pSer/pThr/pTyr-binding forkhead associated (FHA) protein/tetratricopeptide (TPR) repeat protein